jgi:5-methylcytosine-specific restriction endonuclease McrA
MDGYTCQRCGRKKSKAKGKEFDVEVHHKDGVLNWDMLINLVYDFLLCSPEHLETLCPECHDKEGKPTN